MAAAVVVAAAVALVLMVVRPWGSAEPSPGEIEVDPARVAELEAAEAERATRNLAAAGELATSAQERLLPVMDGLYEALPPEGEESGDAASASGEPRQARPTAAELGEWRDVVDQVTADAETLPSGSSEHNIVRNGLMLSTGLLGDTLDVLELAGGTGGTGGDEADASEESGAAKDSERLYGIADDLRTRAVDAWGVAAVQLDLQYVGADRGHLHAFLPLHSGMSAEGEAEPAHGHP